MNIFDQFVLPPNQEHVGLLTAMQIISLLTFLPFMGIMLGATTFSVFFKKAGIRNNNPLLVNISKDILDKLTIGKAVGYALGILPLATITIIYAQMLYGAQVISVSMMLLSLLLFIVSFIFIYNYKNGFQIESILNSLKKDEKIPDDVAKFENQIKFFSGKYGSWGVSLLYLASFLFIGATTVAGKPEVWASTSNILKFLISAPIWVNYLSFIAASFAITGGAMLFFFFVWQGGVENQTDKYKEQIKKIAISSAMIGTLAQPVFMFVSILFMSVSSSSSSVYVFGGFTLLAILIVTNLLYYIYKNSDMKLSAIVFFMMFVVFTFGIVKDQLAFRNAVKEHLLTVNLKAEEITKEKESLIVQVSGADGEKIYNEKCIACHKFDVKLVGPPYQETVPKYNGDLKKLAGFIYNPQKVNPAFPPMPNQGLKMKDAEAVAKYIMDKVGKK